MPHVPIFAYQVLRTIDQAELDVFTLRGVAGLLDLPTHRLLAFVETLVNRGLLSRIEKGKYCRHTFRNEYVISNYLAIDGVVAYWSALHLHALTEQIPNVVFVQTAKQKRNKTVFGVRYQFIKVKPKKMIGWETAGFGNHQYRVTDMEKTIVDCFDLPQYSGGFEELIRAYAQAQLDPAKLITYAQAANNIAVVKRLAYLAELLQKPELESFIQFALGLVNAKYNLFDAFGHNEGNFNSRWKLRLNTCGSEILHMVNKQN